MGDLKVYPSEKTVLVTGAASERGIGRGVARRLATAGWSVGLMDVNAVQVEQTAAAIAAETGSVVIGQGADVSDERSVEAAIQRFEDGLPAIVALVNLAGISDPTPFLEATREQWERSHAHQRDRDFRGD